MSYECVPLQSCLSPCRSRIGYCRRGWLRFDRQRAGGIVSSGYDTNAGSSRGRIFGGISVDVGDDQFERIDHCGHGAGNMRSPLCSDAGLGRPDALASSCGCSAAFRWDVHARIRPQACLLFCGSSQSSVERDQLSAAPGHFVCVCACVCVVRVSCKRMGVDVSECINDHSCDTLRIL